MSDLIKTEDYKEFIKTIKSKIQTSQIKAVLKVNEALLGLYWDLGAMIVQKQKDATWGDGLLAQISRDLKKDFPNMKGFSHTNIKYMRNWYLFFIKVQSTDTQIENAINPQPVDDSETRFRPQAVDEIFQIPWGHNREIITKCKTVEEALFYVNKTIEHNYSRAVLIHQMEIGLYKRIGGAITNFSNRLPVISSDLANETLKDPYIFDFLNIREKHDELELEDALMDNMTHFLLELGQGFSFVGRQYRLEVGESEFKIDLLFYHVKLYCYVVVELKVVDFKPEFAGKLNFYVSAVDGEVKGERDNPTIGILICRSKNDTVVEYALKNIDSPIGVSEYQLTQILPDNLKSSLPTIEEIERELGGEG